MYLGGGRAEAGFGAAGSGHARATTSVCTEDASAAGSCGDSGGGLAVGAMVSVDGGGDETVAGDSSAGEVRAVIA